MAAGGAPRVAAAAEALGAMREAGRQVEGLLGRLGFRLVAGVDEVGMGPLAGPVVAAAVVLPSRGRPVPVADSKTLDPAVRERLAGRIRRRAVGIGIGVVEAADVDRLNVYQAGLEAMRRAIATLAQAGVVPDFLVLDGRALPGASIPQVSFPKADEFVASAAAASVVAKVERDAMMTALHADYPEYGFASHMGYGTPAHLAALAAHGPSPIHRRSFAPVALAATRGAIKS